MVPPTVSIIIPVFNQWSYTKECLRCLEDPSITTVPVEVVVVDNCSTDETAKELAAWEQRWPALKVERLDRNTGFSPASNHGARVSSAPLLLFLNNDTEPLSGWLEPLIEALKDPHVGMVGPKLVHADGTINHGGYAFRHGSFVPMYFGYPGNTPGANKVRDYQALLGACLLIRRELFNEVGEFSLDGLEDIDLCLKIGKLGLVSRYIPASTVVHHGSVTLRCSPPGSFPITDTKGFAGRWSQHTIRIDEHSWYLVDGEWPKPAQQQDRSSEQLVQESVVHLARAHVAEIKGQLEESLKECLSAEASWPLNPHVYMFKCSILIKLGRTEEALREIARRHEFSFFPRLEEELASLLEGAASIARQKGIL